MKCQHCGNLDTEVLETRDLMRGTVVRRRRGCGHCGQTFATYEIDGGIWGTVKKWALGDRAKALEKKHDMRRRDGEIVAMIKAGHQLKDIGNRYNLSVSTICYVAKKAGLPNRRGPARTKEVTNPWTGLL
jgi:hypothetical protein